MGLGVLEPSDCERVPGNAPQLDLASADLTDCAQELPISTMTPAMLPLEEKSIRH